MFCQNNCETSLSGDVFISCDRVSNEETACTYEASHSQIN